jgi:hypothetical protein
MARTRGRARIYVNGHLAATIDLARSSARTRSVVWRASWSSVATRTIRIVVAGTRNRPRVDVDAFVTVR